MMSVWRLRFIVVPQGFHCCKNVMKSQHLLVDACDVLRGGICQTADFSLHPNSLLGCRPSRL